MVYGFSARWSSRLGSSLSWFMVLSHGILFWALMVGLQEVELKVGTLLGYMSSVLSWYRLSQGRVQGWGCAGK